HEGTNERSHSNGNTAPVHSVWWTWTAPFSGGVELSVTRNFSVVLAVYVGDALERLTTVTNLIFANRVIFNAAGGTTYRIAADGWTAQDMGDFTLSLQLAPPPVNDRFADAFDLTGPDVAVQGSNVAATREPGEPEHGGLPGG